MLELGDHQGWVPPIIPTVAATGEGTGELWTAIKRHRDHIQQTGRLADMRRRRLVAEMESALLAGMRQRVRTSVPPETWDTLMVEVSERRLDPWNAANRLLTILTD
jgi:LAO/AO transport system kinase